MDSPRRSSTRNDSACLVNTQQSGRRCRTGAIAPLIAGCLVAALRLAAVSGAVDSVEKWLRAGSAKAAAKEGKFARFFERPFYRASLAIWRWTAQIRDVHLRAGVRVTALILISGIACWRPRGAIRTGGPRMGRSCAGPST